MLYKGIDFLIFMKFIFNTKLMIKIILAISFIVFISIFTPVGIKNYGIFKIKNIVIEDFKNNNVHSNIIKTYMGETGSQNFYFYIEYKESDIVYITEYLCQKIDKEWVFYCIAKDFLKNEE